MRAPRLPVLAMCLVCHRGTVNALACWRRKRVARGGLLSAQRHPPRRVPAPLQRRDHLQAAAIGAQPHYRRVPQAHRPETPAQVAEVDALCAAAWLAYPGYVLVANDGRDWPVKARAAQDLLQNWLPVETGGVHQ